MSSNSPFSSHSIFAEENLDSMRYSRMLEESSFANRKADYFWLLLVSSVMLLVSKRQTPRLTLIRDIVLSLTGPFPVIQPPFPILAARLRSHLHVVSPPPVHTDLSFRSRDHNRPLPPLRPRRLLMDAQRHLARRSKRSRRLCGRSRRLVRPRCMDARDDRWPHDSQ